MQKLFIIIISSAFLSLIFKFVWSETKISMNVQKLRNQSLTGQTLFAAFSMFYKQVEMTKKKKNSGAVWDGCSVEVGGSWRSKVGLV